MARLLAALVTVVIVVVGVWFTGAVLTEDATVAMGLTGGWFMLAGAVAVALGWRRRWLALPVVGAWLVTSTLVGGFLLVTSTVDQVADEDVITAPSGSGSGAGSGSGSGGSGGGSGSSASPSPGSQTSAPQLLADGRFEPAAHPTRGRAALLQVGDDRVLTLTRFATDPGPDLRVYLVPGDGSSVKGGIDLGALHGNKGDQQYDVPKGAPTGAVVIWCRAFSVAFGSAQFG